MKYEITHSPTFSKLDLELDREEFVFAQPDSMLTMTTGVEVSGRVGGQMKKAGVVGGLKSLLLGENFFTAVFTAREDGQKISLAPPSVGEIVPYDLSRGALVLTSGSFLAASQDLELEMIYGGFKGFLARKGLFLMKAGGRGTIFLSSFGAVIHHELAENEKLVVDNRYVIAFSDTLSWKLVKAAKTIRNAVMSGEGLVNLYTGPGTLLFQTRGKSQGRSWILSMIEAVT